MWPFCRQPLYASAMPLMFNATILNGLGLTGKLEAPPAWTPGDDGGRLLDVQVRLPLCAAWLRLRAAGESWQLACEGSSVCGLSGKHFCSPCSQARLLTIQPDSGSLPAHSPPAQPVQLA